MGRVVRSVLAVVVGLFVGGILIQAVELLGLLVHPLPADFDANDAEALARYMAAAPPAALLVVLVAWFLGTCTGAWLAARLARRAPLTHALVVGLLFLALGCYNLASFPHPLWFWVLGLAVFLPAAALGGMLERRRSSAQPLA